MAQPHQDLNKEQPDWVNTRRLTELLYDLIDNAGEPVFEYVTLPEGDVLFAQGDEGDSMYLLQSGVVGVRIAHADGRLVNIARLAPGAIVGEMALLSGSKRSATVFAMNDAGLLRVTKDQFQALMEADQAALAEMSAAAIPRWQRQQLANALQTLLGEVDVAALDALQAQMVWQYYANGDVIFRQGDPSDGMYIVVNGRLQATVSSADGSVKNLGIIGPGEPLGEMGVIADAPRSATVHALREGHLVKLTPVKFRRLIRQYPDLMINIARVIVERQQRFMQGAVKAQPVAKTLAIIPGKLSLDAPRFAQALRSSLARFGSTLVLDSDSFDEKYGEPLASQSGPDDLGNMAIIAWLNALDTAEQFILYVADPFPSPWTRRCLNHADRVLILVDPDSDPLPGKAEQILAELEVPPRSELVFWHPSALESLPEVTAWLAVRQAAGHHFVCRGDAEQMDHLAEELAV
jgi:NTE family protein